MENIEELKKKYPSMTATSVGAPGEWDKGVAKGEAMLKKRRLHLNTKKLSPEQIADIVDNQILKK